MTRAIPLRTDYTADDLRRFSRCSSNSKQTRRLLALAMIYDGSSRLEAARHANVDVQSIRDWVLRFNEEYRVTVSDSTLSRILHDMGYRKLSARPRHHAQDPMAGEAFKKTFQPVWQKSGADYRQIRP